MIFRQVLSFSAAAALTWWILYRAPAPVLAGAAAPAVPVSATPASLSLRPVIEEMAVAPPAQPLVETEPDVPEEPAPPPPEAGSRSGTLEGDLAEAPSAADATEEPAEEESPEPRLDEAEAAPEEPIRPSVAALASDPELLDIATAELRGEAAVGFSTVFVASPEHQLDIARAFGEELVLVPRAALDPDDPSAVSYRLDLTGRAVVRQVPGRPPLERYRQYRDLFAYDHARLPAALKELRRSVVRRDHVWLFAALIPASEWAVVIGRRREALARLGVDESDVERFVVRYVRERDGVGFDIRVDSVILANGTRLTNIP